MSRTNVTEQRTASSMNNARRMIRRTAVLLPALAAGILLASGCSSSSPRMETGFGCPHLVQVQFDTPPGAEVSLRDLRGTRTHEVNAVPASTRLEQLPDHHATFQLQQGYTYPFVYTHADGFQGAAIYGEVQVPHVTTKVAEQYIALSFVPVSLFADYESPNDQQFYPSRGPSGVGLDQLKYAHLREGDMVQRVFFVADLQKAWETIRDIDFHTEKLRSAETIISAELELLDSRYESYRRDALYVDPTMDPMASYSDTTGASKEFIRLEAERQGLANKRFKIRQQLDDLSTEKRIRTRLLDNMQIINRQGSLVLATPENQFPYHDPATQVGKSRKYEDISVGPLCGGYSTGCIELPPLGETVLVVRLGGRHKDWLETYRSYEIEHPELAKDTGEQGNGADLEDPDYLRPGVHEDSYQRPPANSSSDDDVRVIIN